MTMVVLYSLVIGAAAGLGGYWLNPNLAVLGPAMFIISLLFLEKVWKES